MIQPAQGVEEDFKQCRLSVHLSVTSHQHRSNDV